MNSQIDLRRVFAAAAHMNPGQARQVINLSIKALEAEMEVPQPTEGERAFAKRVKSIERIDKTVRRICAYAKHETLRNIEKHFRNNPGITGASESGEDAKPSSLAARLAFKRPDFSAELLAALREEAISALGTAGQHLFDEMGRDDPFKMPDQAALDYLDTRENLLSQVSDEMHREIMDSIQEGLNEGETRKEIMARVASRFDEITEARSQAIAHTETASAFNYARDEGMRQAGVMYKQWLHSQSPLIKEPRETHVEADGQTVPIDEPFDVGGVRFMYPTDDSLGAGPEDIVNCHCVSIPVEAP